MRDILKLFQDLGESAESKIFVKLGLIVGLSLFSAAVVAGTPFALAGIIAFMTNATAGSANLLILCGYVFLYLACLSIPRFLSSHLTFLQSSLRLSMIKGLSALTFNGLCSMPSCYFHDKNMGYLSQGLTQLSNEYFTLIRTGLGSFLMPIVQVLISFGVLIAHGNFNVTLSCIAYAVVYYCVYIKDSIKLDETKMAMMQATRDSYSVLVDSLQNISVARQYGSGSYLSKRYEKVLDFDEKVQLDYWRIVLRQAVYNNTLFVLLFGFCFLSTAVSVASGTATLSELILVGTYVMSLALPLEALATSFVELKVCIRSIVGLSENHERVFEGGKISFDESDCSIYIKNLKLMHPAGGRRFSLDISSLAIPSGCVLGVTGLSGAGKTTLLNVISKELSEYEGEVRIGSTHLRDVSAGSMSKLIGVVRQDALILQDTVRNNMRIACPEADDAQIEAALCSAGLSEFASSQSNSLDTILGDRGVDMSGGQRQRLSLARLYLTNPRIILLDESTAFLDVDNEAAILDSVLTRFSGSTIILVSHKSSVLKKAHNLIVLDQGTVIASGKSKDVIKDSEFLKRVFGP